MKKVLLIEDNEMFVKAFKALTKHKAPEIILLTAESIWDGRALMDTHKDWDLVILDGSINAPLDGLELIEELRTWNYEGPILTIAGTGTDRQKMLEFGATDEADKTLGPSKVIEKALEILARAT
ncbi:MAG: two component transcriptional regulator, winged helix family [Parcubacteria group bacterium]|nr:two component transcriptional regulator, winged helix family [Parcubacteria group bacterium]